MLQKRRCPGCRQWYQPIGWGNNYCSACMDTQLRDAVRTGEVKPIPPKG